MRSLILDSNLALLLVVGLVDVRCIIRHKRLAAYQPRDWGHLNSLVSDSRDGLLWIPNVVTETSNLIRMTNAGLAEQASAVLAKLVAVTTEVYVSTENATRHPAYLRLGLTDAALLTIAREGHVLLTADGGLYRSALEAGVLCTNYLHERDW